MNSTASKHGIGKPFVDMRNAMMLGTVVVTDGKYIRIRSNYAPPIPVILAPDGMNDATCSSALAKMTASMYQREIDTAKHGKTSYKLTAVQLPGAGSLLRWRCNEISFITFAYNDKCRVAITKSEFRLLIFILFDRNGLLHDNLW